MQPHARASSRVHTRHTDATQISSAITQNASRARKRGPPFCLPSSSRLRLSRSENRSDPVAHTTAHMNFTKWRVHRKDYLCRARVSDVGVRIDRVRLWRGLLGLQIKELDRALSKNANCTQWDAYSTLVRKIARICVGEKMCGCFFFLFLEQMQWPKKHLNSTSQCGWILRRIIECHSRKAFHLHAFITKKKIMSRHFPCRKMNFKLTPRFIHLSEVAANRRVKYRL